MHVPSSVLWAIGLTITSAYGYELNFHKSPGGQCASEAIGSWSGDLSSGCHKEYAGAAHDIRVTPDSHEGSHTVAFYSSDDCNPENLIKKHHIGCSAPKYRSFRVVERATHFKVGNTNSPSSLIAATSKNQKLRREQGAFPVSHGDVFDHHGVTRRWHQLAKDTFSGVPIDEWDDEIHTASDHELKIESSLTERDIEESFLSLLSERDLEDGTGMCMDTIQCTADLVSGAVGGLKKWAPIILDKAVAAAKENGEPLWDFLNKPFITALMGGPVGMAGTIGAMFVNNKYAPGLDKDQAGQCMTEGTAQELIKALVANTLATNNVAAMMSRVEGDKGELADVSVAVDEDGEKPIDCGVTGE
ncbi:hypothetical protein N7471_013181 [Penicillium samsonianum]|uniref:uncharacterized protein n=1 Tax=Penicillium samsonianum TaxID=1882272 RepID=UPI002548080E|nr:uncharacterized protein N7471_013181 [Penicillium samsonianum]KAJ6118561.1 hypothetical protein N7471_013181 [Penicillium samsonianum]